MLIERESSITEALASLTQCLPAATDTTPFVAPHHPSGHGPAPPPQSETSAVPAAPSVRTGTLKDENMSLSLTGILSSLTSAIEPQPTQHLAQTRSHPSSNPHSQPESPQHAQHQDAPLEGLGGQLLELRHHFQSSSHAQAAPKPRSKAAALAEAIQKVQAEDEARAAAAAAAAQAGVVVPPAPDFTLLSEEVEQTLHQRHVDDHHKKHHRGGQNGQARSSAASQYRKGSRDRAGPPVPPPSPPFDSSNASKAPFPPAPPNITAAPPVSMNLPDFATAPPPGVPVPPGEARIHLQGPPHAPLQLQPPMPPAAPKMQQVTIMRPPNDGIHGPVTFLQPGLPMLAQPGVSNTHGGRAEPPGPSMDQRPASRCALCVMLFYCADL